MVNKPARFLRHSNVLAERQKYVKGGGNAHISSWQDFVTNIRNNTSPPSKTITIHENVWLIPLANGLPFLGDLVRRAESCQIPMRVLFLEEEPTWIKYPPDAKTDDETKSS
jgi:hypothetical protein